MKKNFKSSKKTIIIWVLFLMGFAFMEFPGVLLFQHKSEPNIFGLPFIHGYMILCWIYMCCVAFYAYKTHWGRVEKGGGG